MPCPAAETVLLETSLTTSASLAGAGTYLLQSGSPAIDAADPVNYPSVDVFGTSRPQRRWGRYRRT
ncbi:MAG: choice-of-anchor Q domain-containing protein [Syntrophotaleaceae bacterium]